MKVLHLPTNIASQASISVRALRDIGIDARCLVKGNHILEDTRGIEVIPPLTARRYSPARLCQKLRRWHNVLAAIHWADIIHWHFKSGALPMELDLRFIAFLKKPCLVEFWGSDIRISEIASKDNPYIARMYNAHPELATGCAKCSYRIQRKFARYGFECIVPDVETESYIQRDCWCTLHKSTQRLVLSDFDPVFPDADNRRPVIIHAPSKKAIKGSDTVFRSIDQLKQSFDFEFLLIHGVEHIKAIEMIRGADIFIDQLNIGSHGLAAVEAMALGKPTLCYLKPSLVGRYPSELPIVNVNHDNLTEVLSGLIQDGQKRHEIGLQSRRYVEKYHDAHKVARDLVKLYEQLIHQKQKGRSVENHRKDV